MWAVERLIEELGCLRTCYTNVPIYRDLVIREVRRRYGHDCSALLRILPDEHAPKFWLHVEVPCYVQLDEAHNFFGPKGLTPEGLKVCSQWPKQGCGLSLITQHPAMVDVTLRDRLCQRYWYAVNSAYRMVYGMRGASGITMTLHAQWPPDKFAQPETTVRLSPAKRKLLGDLYDTSAGVGVLGGTGAESPPRARSLWPAMIAASLVLCGVGVYSLWSAFGRVKTVFPNQLTNSLPALGATNRAAAGVVGRLLSAPPPPAAPTQSVRKAPLVLPVKPSPRYTNSAQAWAAGSPVRVVELRGTRDGGWAVLFGDGSQALEPATSTRVAALRLIR